MSERAARAAMPVTVVGATTAVQALVSMGMLTLPAIAPIAAAAVGVAPALIGAQVSLLYGIAMISSLFGARWVRRFGAARTSQAALCFIAAGLLMASVPSVAFIALGSVFMGIAYGLPNPAAAHLLIRFTSPLRRNLVFSLKQTGVPLGGVLAGLSAPSLAQAFGWQAPLLVTAVAALALALLFAPVRSYWDEDRDPAYPFIRVPAEALHMVLVQPVLRLFLGVGLLLAAVQLCLMTFLVVLLVEERGFDPIAAGATLAAVQVAGVAGRIVWGLVADRTGRGIGAMLLIAGAIAVLAAALPLAGGAGPALTILILVALGATAVAWNGVFLAETARLSPAGLVGEATAVVLSATYLGVLIGPALFAALMPVLGGYAQSFVLLAVAAAAAAGLLVAARARAA